MTSVFIKYNPYLLQTSISVNGCEVESDSELYRITKGKRLQEWCGKLPEMLVDELNSLDFNVEFHGMELDYDDIEDSFIQAKNSGVINKFDLKYIAAKSDEDVHDRIVKAFNELQNGPVEDFRNEKLIKAFNNVNNSVFPINVIATMSSGKSTLINSMLRKRLMPAKNAACTAIITEILDTDDEVFRASVYNVAGDKITDDIPNLTYDIMSELNENPEVFRIISTGDIPFIDANDTALKLVDTPGPNNAQNQDHQKTTYHSINNDSNNLILYVLNATQLGTNDDSNLLKYVSEQIKKGGKQARDRFMFVINKMDEFDPVKESIEKAIDDVKAYLSRFEIEEPQIYPVSAFTALNIRTELSDVDVDNLTPSEVRKLSPGARKAYYDIFSFIDYEQMHLEKYSTLSPSAQRELEFRLHKAIEKNDTKEQALIHCGIYSIEAAITAYVKKYAKTKKIKDLVETFNEVLFSNQVLVKAKTQVATDEEAAKACSERAEAIRAKIADGSEAKEFKKRVAGLDPIPKIKEEARKPMENATRRVGNVFNHLPAAITSRDEALRIIKTFSSESRESFAELTVELESIVNKEIVENGNLLLSEYQHKLEQIDDSISDSRLDFSTSDLIKGALSNMREEVTQYYSDEFADETIDDIGEVDYEEREYYEKTGQEEVQVYVGSHEEVVGTKRVKVGSHTEYGTRRVANPKKQGFFGKLKFWQPNEIDEEYSYEVDDYEEREITKVIKDFKTELRDVFEKRTEKIEKFSLKTDELQTALLTPVRDSLKKGIDETLAFAKQEIDNMKKQFSGMFDELDEFIKAKYAELEKCAQDESTKKAEYEKNKKILNWIEACETEINEILEI